MWWVAASCSFLHTPAPCPLPQAPQHLPGKWLSGRWLPDSWYYSTWAQKSIFLREEIEGGKYFLWEEDIVTVVRTPIWEERFHFTAFRFKALLTENGGKFSLRQAPRRWEV